ncbi:hypothetical protein HZF05_18510 [Sphingomonas sp. CGMCC 1.13654]|uniref:Uncharacterized protein n=1 Tax=Sphingomonas chungangi TaxID=2683589 RepID=A0A838LBU8_9SPHN|nr:hypothetical protein [Sphingomonas chungangi]MBA2936079.1 hypothetical protein [Sphingomonas chungangi]MVW55467.1 hypothetical protein [Sphingomonas chungangi]
MDAFSYLSVLLSIIIGLAITQVLQGYRAMLLARRRVKLFAPTIIWSVLILVLATQSWWSSFGLTDVRVWTFGVFGLILLQTVLLYMLAAIVLPDAGEGVIDLAVHYREHVTAFFAIMLAMLAVSVAKDLSLPHHSANPIDLAGHGVFAAISLVALRFRTEPTQLAVAIAATAFIIGYIVILFGRLTGG